MRCGPTYSTSHWLPALVDEYWMTGSPLAKLLPPMWRYRPERAFFSMTTPVSPPVGAGVGADVGAGVGAGVAEVVGAGVGAFVEVVGGAAVGAAVVGMSASKMSSIQFNALLTRAQ